MKNHKLSHIVIGIMFSLMSGWMIAAMALSGTWNIDQFYDSGEIYDIDFDGRMAEFPGISYENTDGCYHLTENEASLTYTLRGDFTQWNYLYLTTVKMNQKQVQATAHFYLNGVYGSSQELNLKEGKNEVDLSGQPFQTVVLEIRGQQGTAFSIRKMQFRENAMPFTMGGFIGLMLVVALVVEGILLLLGPVLRKKRIFQWYGLIDGLQGLWMQFSDTIGEKFYDVPKKKRSIIRVGVICALVLSMSTFENLVYLHSKPNYGISMALCCVAVTILALYSLEGETKKQNWRNPLTASWLFLWILATISDIFVDKRYQYQGLIMVFFVGYFFFVWSNMKKRTVLIQDIMWGCEASFWVTTIFVYLCRPQIEEFRFTGFFRNPNIEAAYAAAAFILFLVELDNRILKKSIGKYGIFCAIGLIVAFDRTWRSGGRTGQMAVAAAAVVFLLHNFRYCRKNGTILSGIKIVSLCLLLAVPVLYADNWIFHNLPGRLGTQVIYPKDLNYMGSAAEYDSDTVYAAELDGQWADGEMEEQEAGGAGDLANRRSLKSLLSSGSFYNALEAFSSGRTLYYVAYVRQMNLFGHYYHPKNWGDYIYPHNGLLEIMYRYGIFAGIPYICMLFISIWYAFLYARKKRGAVPYKLFPLTVTLGMGCTLLLENGEKPFVWMIWVLYYLGMGILFNRGEKTKEGIALED